MLFHEMSLQTNSCEPVSTLVIKSAQETFIVGKITESQVIAQRK